MNSGSERTDPGEIYQFEITQTQAGERLDKALTALCARHEKCEDFSRARIQALIKAGQVLLNGKPCRSPSSKPGPGDILRICVPAPVEAVPEPEKIPLDILYEDEDLIVLNKQAGLVVHPGAGNPDGTLVNALLHHCGDSLSGIGGVLRPGIVHRLDKDTSGLMIAAKNDKAHRSLSRQLAGRTLSRIYKALVLGVPMPVKGAVNTALGRDPRNRIKMAVRRRGGKAAKTYYEVTAKYKEALALLECRLESGRTHQIRAHMQSIKHPIVGDPLYGPQATALRAALQLAGCDEPAIKAALDFPRQALHACALKFVHPASSESMSFKAPLPADIANLLDLLKN